MKLSRIISLPITVIALIISTSTLADNQRRIDVDSKVVTQGQYTNAKNTSQNTAFQNHRYCGIGL